jgi:hypothetical protein
MVKHNSDSIVGEEHVVVILFIIPSHVLHK